MAELVDFVHEPLEFDRPAFRLLQLLRGDQPTIECMLYQAFLHGMETIPYDALSYTWGGTEKADSILVNGKAMKITSNLHSALQHVRSTDMDKVLWIDAICIDQDNERERGHQVQQMCKIYSQAEEVIVWLGHATHATDLLMESLQHLEQYSSVQEYRGWDLKQWATFWELIPRYPSLSLAEGLEILLKRPWFRRIWILQEIARSKKARIWCGSKSIKSHIFAIAPALIGIEPERHCRAVLDIMPGRLREDSWWSESRDLFNLLSKFRESEASDPRDKVYALLGISSDAQDTDNLRPDYSKSVQQVIQDTSCFLFGPLDLSYATMSSFLLDLSSRHAAAFVNILRTSDLRGVEHFLVRRGLDTPLPEGAMEAIIENKNSGSEIMNLVLRTRGNEVTITEKLMRAGVENMEFGADNVILLLRTCRTSNDYKEVRNILQTASARGNRRVVELLLVNSSMLDSLDPTSHAQDECFRCALYSAAANGQETIIKLLFALNTGTNGQDVVYDIMENDLALPLAAANGHHHIVGMLQGLGADIGTCFFPKDRHGGAWSTAAKSLVNKGAEVSSHGMIYVNPLYLASVNGHDQVVKLLIEKGANVNAHSSMYSEGCHGMYSEGCHGTAVEAASARGHEKVVKMLLESGARLED